MGVTEHISKQFEADLDTTRTRVLQMGGLVEAQILAAIQAFATGDAALVAQVIENDARVNGYEVAIERRGQLLVRRSPPPDLVWRAGGGGEQDRHDIEGWR